MIDCKRLLEAFTEKLSLFQGNTQNKEFHNISELGLLDDTLTDEDIKEYRSHLQSLKQDKNNRFSDLFSFEVLLL